MIVAARAPGLSTTIENVEASVSPFAYQADLYSRKSNTRRGTYTYMNVIMNMNWDKSRHHSAIRHREVTGNLVPSRRV